VNDDPIDDEWLEQAGFFYTPGEKEAHAGGWVISITDEEDDSAGEELRLLDFGDYFRAEVRSRNVCWIDGVGFGRFATRTEIDTLCRIFRINIFDPKL